MSDFPILNHPVYGIARPSDGKWVKYCPYTVKDEKILLMAAESKERGDIVSATRKIVQNCLEYAGSQEDLGRVGEWPIFDVNFLFMHCRARSVANVVSVLFTCNNQVNSDEDSVCGHQFKVDVNIDAVEVSDQKDMGKVFDIGDGYTVTMKYPSYNSIENVPANASDEDISIAVMASSIERISKGKEDWSVRDATRAQVLKFVESLRRSQFDVLKDFLDNMPEFSIKVSHTCEKCGFVHALEFDDLPRFF
jgi:rubrerythrin